jgi:hypothetical protein
MNDGYVDSSSVHVLMGALKRPDPHSWELWTWETVQGVTSALWRHPNLSVAPDPGHHAGARGPFDRLLRDLSTAFSGFGPSDSAALTRTKQWASKNARAIAALHQQLHHDPSYVQMVDWWVSDWWVSHCHMHGALFTESLIPQLARILSCSEADLRRIHTLTADPARVRDWSANRPDNEEFNLAREAYVSSIIVRGHFHDVAARRADRVVMHVPLRVPFLPRVAHTVEHPVSNTELNLINIVVCGSLAETNLERRIDLWASNVLKVRDLAHRRGIRFDNQASHQESLILAQNAAREADVRVHPRLLEAVVDAAATAATAVTLTSLQLSPWMAGAAAILELAASRGLRFGERVMAIASLSDRHLATLADAGPGRLRARLGPPPPTRAAA